MLVHEINLDFINKIQQDNYGRVSGIFLVNKPVGVTSHDVVDDVRRILRTKRVGHAGALDPFASGLLIVLVGKYTKYTDALISQDKAYDAEVLFGVSTDTQDPEGKILEVKNVSINDFQEDKLLKLWTDKFTPSYEQSVPVFSSVKINGQKLRILARSADSFEITDSGDVIFTQGEKQTQITLPKKIVKITEFTIQGSQQFSGIELQNRLIEGNFVTFNISVGCSKGTYIRQLAEDMGRVLGIPASLIQLHRKSIAAFNVSDALPLTELYNSAVALGVQNKDLSELRLNCLG